MPTRRTLAVPFVHCGRPAAVRAGLGRPAPRPCDAHANARWRPGLAAALLTGALLPLSATSAERLLVVTSSDHGPFQQAEAGLRKTHPAVETLQVTPEDAPALRAALARLPRDAAIVTLGRRASALVAEIGASHPVVHCMAGGDPGVRSPAVPLEVPLDAQIALLKRLLPGARNVGMLFDPALNERRVDDIAAAWRRAGFVPVMAPVTGSAALPGALTRLSQGVDVLYAVPDATVYSAEHSRALLLYSFRNRIPLVGPSEGWVRAGALYALEWDYADVGRYCGALAAKQLAGPRAPVPPPPRTRAVANARTASQQRVQWDADVRRVFDRVYE